MRTRIWGGLVIVALVTACGGGGGDGEEALCGQVLGTELVQPLLDVHEQQVQLDIEFVTVERTHLDSLGITWPLFSPIQTGRVVASAGAFCGATQAAATSVVGGVAGQVVLLPQGFAGQATLPLISPSPVTPNSGAMAFTDLAGPGTFTIAPEVALGVSGLDPVVGGQVLPSVAGAAGSSLNYLLTDSAGRTMFLTEVQADANTRVVSTPPIVTLINQSATIFVGTEFVPVTEIEPPLRDAVPVVNPGATAVEIGVSLEVTPVIRPDGNIQLFVVPQLSTVLVQSPEFTLDGTPSVAHAPVIRKIETVAQIAIQPGVTAIVSGIRDDATNMTTRGVPILADLPLVGSIVRSHNQLDLTDDLVLLITPHIVRND